MSKCWYCNNELTTGDNPKHFGICNKCYDEIYKVDEPKYVDMLHKENSELLVNSLAEKDKQIAELQKQLKTQPAEIVEKIKEQSEHSNLGYMGRIEKGYYTITGVALETILKEYQK